jgi:hypothetical protein
MPIPKTRPNSQISLVPSNWLPYIDAARTYRKHFPRVRIRGADHIGNTASSIVAKVCLSRRCLEIEVFVVSGMCSPSRCLAMNIHVTIAMMTGRHLSVNRLLRFNGLDSLERQSLYPAVSQ